MMQDFGTGPGGGMISGKWTNKINGTVVNVRDAIIQDDNMIVITDRGQISGEDFSRNYIQMSDEEYDMKGNVINSTSQKPVQQPKVQPKPIQPAPMMFDEKFDLPEPQPIKQYEQPQYNTQNIDSESNKLIKKLFSKIDSKPEISIDIKWADFPANELNMLMNVFDVTKEDIAGYMRTYLDDEEIKISIGKFIEKML